MNGVSVETMAAAAWTVTRRFDGRTVIENVSGGILVSDAFGLSCLPQIQRVEMAAKWRCTARLSRSRVQFPARRIWPRGGVGLRFSCQGWVARHSKAGPCTAREKAAVADSVAARSNRVRGRFPQTPRVARRAAVVDMPNPVCGFLHDQPLAPGGWMHTLVVGASRNAPRNTAVGCLVNQSHYQGRQNGQRGATPGRVGLPHGSTPNRPPSHKEIGGSKLPGAGWPFLFPCCQEGEYRWNRHGKVFERKSA